MYSKRNILFSHLNDVNLCNISHLVCIIEQQIVIGDYVSNTRMQKDSKKLTKIKRLACFNTNIDNI